MMHLPKRAVLGLALGLFLSTRVESNPRSTYDAINGSGATPVVATSGLVLAPPGATGKQEFLIGDALRRTAPLDAGSLHPGRLAQLPRASASIGMWSELLPGPPSQRLAQSATYDPVRRRLVVFGGLAHLWVFGDLSYLSLDGTESWHHVDPPVSPAPRWGHTAVYDPVRDRIVIFGGATAVTYDSRLSQPIDEVWALDLGTLTWTRLAPSSSGPSARFVHAAIYDPVGDRMIVFGGYDGTFLNDVWELAFAGDGAWSRITTLGSPPTLDAAAAVYDPVHHRMIVDGGFDGSTSRTEVWALSLDGQPSWSQIPAPGGPPARRQHAALYDPVRDRLVVFGGTAVTEGPGSFDTWALQLDGAPTWQHFSPTGSPPSRRWGHSMFYDPVADRAVVFGGVDLEDWRNDTWAVGLAAPAWSPVALSEVAPQARWGHSSVLDVSHDRFLVFMGAGQSRWLEGMWALDLKGTPVWQQVSVPKGPCPRDRASTIHDPLHDRVILFGGETWGAYGDLWELSLGGNEPTWAYLSPPGVTPGPRAGHAAIYDPLRDRMLVFGGSNDWSDLNDVWALSLTGSLSWSRLEPNGPAPDARRDHSAVYDPVLDRMLVFGGVSATQSYDDVWALSLDNPRWTRISAAGSPGARWGHSAIWDTAHDRMLVFAGHDGKSVRSDTWSLTFSPGTGERGDWENLNPDGTTPSRRGWPSAILDASRNRMIVFGGRSDVAFFDDASALDLGPVGAGRGAGPVGVAAEPVAASARAPEALSIARLAVDAGGGPLLATVRLPVLAPVHVEITDVRGRRVAARTLQAQSGERSLTFELGAAARGIYWFRVEQDGRSAAARFALLHR